MKSTDFDREGIYYDALDDVKSQANHAIQLLGG